MKPSTFLSIVFYITTVWAVSMSKAIVSVNGKTIEYGEISTLEIKQLPIESTKDKIDFEIYLKDIQSQPHQMIISLGNGNGLDFSLFPKFNVAKKALKASIPASKLPLNIRNLDKIIIKLIIGDSSHENLIKNLGELVPTEDFKKLVPYKYHERIGLKPEIHHIFRTSPETINPIFPIVFIGFNAVVFLAIVATWFSIPTIFSNFKGISGGQLATNASFLSCIVGFEIVFVRYYLGQTIFTTMFHCFLLSIPSILLGSGTFRWLAGLRKIGRC
ncbi:dolichyl-diphosphooligosaccharide--protein glycosyltransferase subunit Swp1p [[Candida] jaroonii]|uniref:Dolichyl-diphosphooligosaccharide--protein glycosyltransferase subunit Swp1p n=1 Tax=[Candida] jaroonii TaxID=467808 RepID=A0ACA9Y4T8_9ASCO|nr:dolichyl-diphosphooligosaccharide--protein glycosyltransferase subunit Swp1p [[Candida] jaroonii]